LRVALFITCYNDLLYPAVGQAIVRLIRRHAAGSESITRLPGR
jgi:Fe-S oxidoreductase